jgi:hypothetical protein
MRQEFLSRRLCFICMSTALLLFIGKTSFSQNTSVTSPPVTIWANQPYGNGSIAPYTNTAISADPYGNTYVTGSFMGTLTYPTSPSATSFTSAATGSDIFLAKYGPTGNVLWAKKVGGNNSSDVASAIKYDGFGNIYIAGYYLGNTDFDGVPLPFPSNSGANAFIAKFSAASGNLLWVKYALAGSVYSEAFDIDVDKDGNAYVTGWFDTLTFDQLPTIHSNGGTDIFIVKFSSSGVAQWQTSAGSAATGQTESGNGIAVDASGDIFVTGKINGSATHPTYFGNIPLVSNGGGSGETDFFLAKYNQSTSSWEWAVHGGGGSNNSFDYGTNVSLDSLGSAYVSGFYQGTANFGSTTLISTGGDDFFIGKYSTNGNQMWIHSMEGTYGLSGVSNASNVDANGNFYFSGTFNGTVTIGNEILTSNGIYNFYISAWNSNGDFQWAKHIPCDNVSRVHGLKVENNGIIDITAFFGGVETFDCVALGNVEPAFAKYAVAKLAYANSADVPMIQASANNICIGNSTTLSIGNASLNNATDWKWYTGSCGGTFIGSGPSITVTPTQSTTYYARSEGGCGGPGNCGNITISLNNTPPAITSVNAPVAPLTVNTSINLTTVYTGSNITNASIKWGDSSAEQLIADPANSFVVPHTYTAPGVYSITVSLKDACNQTASTVYQYVVVYDPNGGFVTGGGWINSPAGAYRPDITLTGKANFGFEAKYLKGANVPTGNTEFKFQTGNINFKSVNYQWLVVAGSKTQFKGTGTINGIGNYGFMLTAVDGDLVNTVSPDLFRIKIWDINNNVITYDNQYGSSDDGSLTTPISGGSIVIHTEKNNSSTTRSFNVASEQTTSNELAVTVSPNPSVQYFVLNVKTGFNLPITVRIIDILGRTVETKHNVPAKASIKIGDQYLPGVYYAEFIQGDQRELIKLVKLSK